MFYSLVLAAGTLLLEWLDYNYLTHAYAIEFYVGCVAVIFVLIGIWVGLRLTARSHGNDFARNEAALASLAISKRECEVLELIAAGHSNKVIARRLAISPNTVKTHAARLFEKLGVNSRTQAIGKARSLQIVP